MEPLRFELNLRKLSRAGSGLVIAGSFLRAGGYAFPDDAWTDFVLLVLSRWSEAVLGLVRGGLDRANIPFMEGPFEARVEPEGEGVWRARLVETRKKRAVRADFIFEASSFVANLTEVSAAVLVATRERGWWSSDADRLSSALESLRAAKARRVQ